MLILNNVLIISCLNCISLQIAECYGPLRELVEEPPFKEYIPRAWAAIVKIKDAHYKATAHYYAAIIHEKMYEVCSSKEILSLL